MKRYAVSLFAIVGLLWSFGFVVAADDSASKKLSAEEILKKVDYEINKYADQYMKIKLMVKSKELGKREKIFEMYQKGDEKRLIRFLSPGDVKGMAVLITGPKKLYVYLPKMHKVRKVAANNLNQNFAGSDFTQNDMSQTNYSRDFVPTLEKEDADYYYLKCVPKPGTEFDYSYARFKIGKKDWTIWEITYYKGDEPVRRMSNREMTDYNGLKRVRYVEMKNLRTGHTSVLEILEFKANMGLKDSMFTTRYLQWGR